MRRIEHRERLLTGDGTPAFVGIGHEDPECPLAKSTTSQVLGPKPILRTESVARLRFRNLWFAREGGLNAVPKGPAVRRGRVVGFSLHNVGCPVFRDRYPGRL